jgi:hypothetical protein
MSASTHVVTMTVNQSSTVKGSMCEVFIKLTYCILINVLNKGCFARTGSNIGIHLHYTSIKMLFNAVDDLVYIC